MQRPFFHRKKRIQIQQTTFHIPRNFTYITSINSLQNVDAWYTVPLAEPNFHQVPIFCCHFWYPSVTSIPK